MKRIAAPILLLSFMLLGCQALAGSGLSVRRLPGGELDVDVRVVVEDSVVVDTGLPERIGPGRPFGPRYPRHQD